MIASLMSSSPGASVITSMAQLHSCDAVWPGWGHASENPALPRTYAANPSTQLSAPHFCSSLTPADIY